MAVGGRVFDFRMKPHFPSKLTPEFLLVDLANNMERLAEDKEQVLNNVKKKALSMNVKALSKAVRHYGGARTRKFFAEVLGEDNLKYVA